MKTQSRFKKWIRLAIGTGAIASLAFILSACNTVEGVGKDVKGAGKAIENTANKSKSD